MAYSEENWLNVADGFSQKWNMPLCIGAIDGKHIRIVRPPNGGSLFFNHKRYHSIILMASYDADYRFTTFDVGAPGSDGDSNTFARSYFGKDILMDNNDLKLPPSAVLNGHEMSYFLVGDDAFPLTSRIMKPYGGELSNKKKM